MQIISGIALALVFAVNQTAALSLEDMKYDHSTVGRPDQGDTRKFRLISVMRICDGEHHKPFLVPLLAQRLY